jgi:LacI family transcriptional regulator
VVGFDDIELSRYVYPALTTVGQSIRQIGESAAEMLIERIKREGEGAPRSLVMAPELFVRESTAPLSRAKAG